MSEEKEKNTGQEKDAKAEKVKCKHCEGFREPDKGALFFPIVMWITTVCCYFVVLLGKTEYDKEIGSWAFCICICIILSLFLTQIFFTKPFVIGKYIYVAYHNGTIHYHAFPFIYVQEKNSFYLTPDDPSDRIHGAINESDRITAPILKMKVGGWRKKSEFIFHHLTNGHRNLEIVKTKGKMLTIGDRIRKDDSTLIRMTPEKFLPLLENFNIIDDIFNAAKESKELKERTAKADSEYLRVEKGLKIAIGQWDFLCKRIIAAIELIKKLKENQKSKVGQTAKESLLLTLASLFETKECPEWNSPESLNEEAKRLLALCEQKEKLPQSEKQKILQSIEHEINELKAA
ncbi:MAG: hypothetical protein V1928_00190 [Parcubacteria group bacterium]